jgi:hypothetical protein
MNPIFAAIRDSKTADLLEFAELLVSTHTVAKGTEGGWVDIGAGELAEFIFNAANSAGEE